MNKVIWFRDCNYSNKELVGGKNASLGELFNLSQLINFNIADGFAITTNFYDEFLKKNNIVEKVENLMKNIDYDDLEKLENSCQQLRNLFLDSDFDIDDIELIKSNYKELCKLYSCEILDVAVRSSAIAEDLPNASFAGQQDTYLNIKGEDLLLSVKKCFASLFNTRAVSYRKTHNIELNQVKISVGIQKMVRSDIGSAGVAFSIDPETGYDKAIVINSSFGLGELVVSGGVKPDEIILDKRTLKIYDADPIIMKKKGEKNTKIIYSYDGKGTQEVETLHIEKINFSLTNMQAINLGRFVLKLEESYSKMFDKKIGVDVEWALDGKDQKLYIIQTRPETIHSNSNNNMNITKYILEEKGKVIVTGVSVGEKISTGKVKVLESMKEYKSFQKGDILVTDMTTPDWEPIMKISSGIITNKGGRTCHAAIVARELGINAIVGTSNATKLLNSGQSVTMSCAEGEEGKIYEGILKYDIKKLSFDTNKPLPVKLMLNVGNPENSFNCSIIPNSGVGLARLEFIISNYIKIHPLALCNYPHRIPEELKNEINEIIGDNLDGKWYFIKRLARGMAKIASSFYPNDVIVRLSDFKSNEYKNLIGGYLYEPNEENPMIGWRGASRYYSDDYLKGFELECLAIEYVRNTMKMDNIVVMIPFCRTPDECNLVLKTMEKFGLKRGKDGLKIYIMCEIPSNVIEADNFSKYVDGVSIGGNDLLQLTLGIDRDSEKITYLSNHENISYRRMISMAIKSYKEFNVKVGFCGQQPSDSIEFCNFLINEGIDSISVTPDSALNTIYNLTK